ncbi:MAG: PAS domain S-box protein, partial [Chloroflexota bacterium]
VNDIGVLDATGVLRYNAVAHQIEGVDFSWREYYQKARELTSGDTYLIEFIEFKGAEVGKKGILVAAPMFESATGAGQSAPAGKFAGVVVCTLKLDTITQKFVASVKSSDRGHTFLIDDEYTILWPPDESLFGKNLLEESQAFPTFRQVVERMGTGSTGLAEYSYYKFEDTINEYNKDQQEEQLIAYAPIHLGKKLWVIGVWAPQEAARKLIRSSYLQQLVVMGLSSLIVLLGSFHALVVSVRLNKFLKKEVETKVGELRASEDRYRRLVELSPHAISIHSKDKIVFMNSAGAKLLGAENPEQLIGKPIWDLVPFEQRQMVKERYWQIIGAGATVTSMEQRFIRIDGTFFDAELTASPFTYNGKPALQAILRDITERKQAQETLEAAYAFQQSIIDGVAEPIMVVGPDYRVKLMNRAACEFSYGEIDLSKPVFCYQLSHQREVACNDSQHPCPMEQVRQSGQPVTVVHQHYQANGELRLVEVIASPLWGADGTFQGIIESIRDITDRKSAEDAWTQQSQELARSGDDLGQFANKVVKSLQDFFGKLPSD